MIGYFALASPPSCAVQKIPQQLVLHPQPLNLIGLLGQNVFWRSIFSRPSFGTGKDSGFQLAFFSPLTLKQPFYHLLIRKAVAFSPLPALP